MNVELPKVQRAAGALVAIMLGSVCTILDCGPDRVNFGEVIQILFFEKGYELRIDVVTPMVQIGVIDGCSPPVEQTAELEQVIDNNLSTLFQGKVRRIPFDISV